MRNRVITGILAAAAACALAFVLTGCIGGGNGGESGDGDGGNTPSGSSEPAGTDPAPADPTGRPEQRWADVTEMPMYLKGYYELKEGDVAPDFTLELVDAEGFTGETLSLADLSGKIVILDFWATWCRYCVQDMPTWQQIVTEYGDNIVFVAINVGGESFGEMKQFIKEFGYDFTWAVANDGVGESYPFAGIPYDVVIDGKGQIIFVAEGSYGKYAYHVMTGVLNEALANAKAA